MPRPAASAALLRKEGIYSSHLSAWRQQLAAGGTSALEPQKPGRKAKLDTKDRELLALTKRNAELERMRARANAVIGLQKSTRDFGDCPSIDRRGELMAAIRGRDLTIPIVVACGALGLSRATLYRGQSSGPKQGPRRRRRSPRTLSPDERARLLDTLHAEEFTDQPPAEVYATLLERGDYVGSIRTMYVDGLVETSVPRLADSLTLVSGRIVRLASAVAHATHTT